MRGEGYSLSDIAAATGNSNNCGFGGDYGAWWIIIIIILFGWGRNGNWGGGSGVNDNYVLTSDFAQLSKQLSDSYSMTERKLDGINNGLCSLGYQELQNITGVNTNLFNGFANVTTAITTNGYEDRIAIGNVGNQLSQCCCDLKQQLSNNLYETSKAFCSTNNNIAMGVRDIIDSQTANTRAILDAIQTNRIEDLKEANRRLESKNASLELAASQSAQNEYLLNSLRNGCPVNARMVCGNDPIPVQYVTAGCGCGATYTNGCGC